MQYHENGFRPGDPDVFPAEGPSSATDTLPKEVDVLIVGCGPAGLTLAAQLARFPDISTCIIERKAGRLEKGQADGVSCRSMEMFQAFGFAEKVKREAYWVNEATFWAPDPKNPDAIHRTGRIQDVEDGLSEMPHVILNQARVHDYYLDIMQNAPTRLTPLYNRGFVSLEVDRSKEYPVAVQIERQGENGQTVIEETRAKYVVGCDGARSGVRNAIGRKLQGDRAGQAWGVMDILPKTDFPDIRFKSLVKSTGKGNLLIIPREGGHLVRVYIELNSTHENIIGATSTASEDGLLSAANGIFAPYTFEAKEVVWWSVYEVGHSLTDKFDDVPAGQEEQLDPHVFIAGDACHTHSAKAGQGMNVSMGDTFNLGWKLVHVLKGRSDPSLLHSYSAERQTVAQDLIDFDHQWSRLMAAPETSKNTAKETPAFQKYFVEHGRYTAGLSVQYAPSDLSVGHEYQQLAKGFDIGMRLHSAPVVRLADAKPLELNTVIETDAKWRLIAFADRNAEGQSPDLLNLCDFLMSDPMSPVLRHTERADDIDGVIDVRAVLQTSHTEVSLLDLPRILHPDIGKYGLRDYEKVFCPSPKGRDIFDVREIDRENGCVVLVRPDQYVAAIFPLTGFKELSQFFGKILSLAAEPKSGF